MRATWWQWMCRCNVALEILIYVVSLHFARVNQRQAFDVPFTTVEGMLRSHAALEAMLTWGHWSYYARAALVLIVPMLVVVELVAWAQRRERRRSERWALEDAARRYRGGNTDAL